MNTISSNEFLRGWFALNYLPGRKVLDLENLYIKKLLSQIPNNFKEVFISRKQSFVEEFIDYLKQGIFGQDCKINNNIDNDGTLLETLYIGEKYHEIPFKVVMLGINPAKGKKQREIDDGEDDHKRKMKKLMKKVTVESFEKDFKLFKEANKKVKETGYGENPPLQHFFNIINHNSISYIDVIKDDCPRKGERQKVHRLGSSVFYYLWTMLNLYYLQPDCIIAQGDIPYIFLSKNNKFKQKYKELQDKKMNKDVESVGKELLKAINNVKISIFPVEFKEFRKDVYYAGITHYSAVAKRNVIVRNKVGMNYFLGEFVFSVIACMMKKNSRATLEYYINNLTHLTKNENTLTKALETALAIALLRQPETDYENEQHEKIKSILKTLVMQYQKR